MLFERPPLPQEFAREFAWIRTRVFVWAFAGSVIAGVAVADEVKNEGTDELPDIAFLEYLGSWQESDEDWLIVNDADVLLGKLNKDETELQRNDPALDGKESTETDHED